MSFAQHVAELTGNQIDSKKLHHDAKTVTRIMYCAIADARQEERRHRIIIARLTEEDYPCHVVE